MKIAKLVLVFPLIGAPSAYAQIPPDVPVGADYPYSIGGEPVSSVDVFYDQLSPYGVWVDEPRLGRVFIPDRQNYVPFSNGYWQYTDVGFVWISNEPFAWATSHYGRWVFSPIYNRWVWWPDTEWGPSWVEWREYGDDFGWAPLPPSFVADYYAPPIYAWHYVPATRIFDVNLPRYFLPRDRVVVVNRVSRPIVDRRTIGRNEVVVGPRPDRLRAHNVVPRPVRVDPRRVGRLSATETRAAAARAEQRRAEVDRENQRRVNARPMIRDVERRVAPTRPQRPEARQREQQQREQQQRQQQQRQQEQRTEQQQRAQQQRTQQQQQRATREQQQQREQQQRARQQQAEQQQQQRVQQQREQQQRARQQQAEQQQQQRAQPQREQQGREQRQPRAQQPQQQQQREQREQREQQQQRAQQQRAQQQREQQPPRAQQPQQQSQQQERERAQRADQKKNRKARRPPPDEQR